MLIASRRLRSLVWPFAATLAALAILLALGAWQLQRRAEKREILFALDRGAATEPLRLDPSAVLRLKVAPPGRSGSGDGSLAELTRVRLMGVFAPDSSIPVRATLPATKGAASSGLGFFWMTPLRLDDGTIVFVNRGFVPSGGDFRPPKIATPPGPQTIVGLLRAPEGRRFFMAADDPAKGEYAARDPAVMARAAGLDPAAVAPFFVDAERSSPTDATPPVGVEAREMIARIPDNHLQYAVTWFGLALTLVGVFGAFAVARLREAA